MDLERDKENLEKENESQSDKIRSLETNNDALTNSISESEQKMVLLEDDHKEEQFRFQERSIEIEELKDRIHDLQVELERKNKDYIDVSQQAEEFLCDIETEKENSKKLKKELDGKLWLILSLKI